MTLSSSGHSYHLPSEFLRLHWQRRYILSYLFTSQLAPIWKECHPIAKRKGSGAGYTMWPISAIFSPTVDWTSLHSWPKLGYWALCPENSTLGLKGIDFKQRFGVWLKPRHMGQPWPNLQRRFAKREEWYGRRGSDSHCLLPNYIQSPEAGIRGPPEYGPRFLSIQSLILYHSNSRLLPSPLLIICSDFFYYLLCPPLIFTVQNLNFCLRLV